jgi:signal transduction histidine kinase
VTAPASGGIVLVVDDERGPRESLRILLKHEFQVLCADSVDAGLALLQEHHPDAVVLDIRMPGKSGIEGLRAVRELDPTVSVVMFTGFGALETAQEALRLGASDYLKKPFDTTEIQEVIRRTVQRTRMERRRRQTEQDLATLNHQLIEDLGRKEQLAALGQRSAEMAHDLRNPLTAVVGYVALLTEELRHARERLGDQWHEAEDYLTNIERNTGRCRELTDMWLALSRKASAKPSTFALRALVQDVVDSLRPSAEKRQVQIAVEDTAAGATLSADRLQLFRAVQNILQNAIEAAAPGTGRVTVHTAVTAAGLELRIADNGCGMTTEQLARACEPFYTTKGAAGTGLGLYIAQQAVQSHGGTLRVSSRTGEGTAVSVVLPAAPVT